MSGFLGLLVRRLVPRRFHRSERLLRSLERVVGNRVVAGPFAGLDYVGQSFGSVYWPKLLGTYELEIGNHLETLFREPFSTILVAGAAEGYYAVGLAKRFPQARVLAWEAQPEARNTVRELATRNGVADRVELRGICDIGGLSEGLGHEGPVLVVADVDGGEAALLDPAVLPKLKEAWLVVETHDCFVPGVTNLLRERFSPSHDIEFVPSRPRTREDASELGVSAELDGALVQLLSERRPPGNDWLVMTPKGRG